MHFVKFCPGVASCLLSRGKRKYAPLGMRLLWKYMRNYFLVYHLTSHSVLYLQNYKEFEAEILDLQLEKFWISFDIKKCTTSGWALGDENVIGIKPFKHQKFWKLLLKKGGCPDFSNLQSVGEGQHNIFLGLIEVTRSTATEKTNLSDILINYHQKFQWKSLLLSSPTLSCHIPPFLISKLWK